MPNNFGFSIGYQLPDVCRMSDVIAHYKGHIVEVYFPCLKLPSGRGVSIVDEHEWQIMFEELKQISDFGIKLNMLVNATCYGSAAVAAGFAETIVETISLLNREMEISAITTTSLFVAQTVKHYFKNLDVRASVNIGIGSVAGIKSVEQYFDSFYLKRELNRFPGKIRPIYDYCQKSNKKLYLLANSGCLRECPAHTFHDNLVSHEHELVDIDENWRGFHGSCWNYYRDKKNFHSFLFDSTWIRPEDVRNYIGYTDGIKLATRTHQEPWRVIDSYVQGCFDGNILSLCEPDFSKIAYLNIKSLSENWMSEIDNVEYEKRKNYYNRIIEQC